MQSRNQSMCKLSVLSHHAAVEWSVKQVQFCPVICHLVWQAVSNLYCYCQKHNHFSLSSIILGRRSIVKTDKAPVIISSGVEPSLTYVASLSLFPLGPPVGVFTALFWRWEGSVHCGLVAVVSMDVACYERHHYLQRCWLNAGWVEP
jgi:hypothetical protein